MGKLLSLFILFTLLLESSYALVDYTPKSSPSRKTKMPAIDISNLKSSAETSSVSYSSSSRSSLASMFYFSTGYNSIAGEEKKFDQYNLGVTMMTPWNVYFDVDLVYGGGTEEGSSFSLGNTEFSVGATWLEFGRVYDMISVDVIGGLSLGVDKSDIGTQRSDSYVGVLTKKNFGSADISLGFEYWFMDEDEYENEISVGAFNKYLVNAGWTVSNDIRFDLSIQFINLGDIQGSDDISYTEISPQIGLRLASRLNMVLGARFSSEKDLGELDLDRLKVWNVSSLYGSSFFTKMSFNF